MDNRQATNRIYQAHERIVTASRILAHKFNLSAISLEVNISASRDPLAAAVVQCDLCASLLEAMAIQIDTFKSAPVDVPVLMVEQAPKPKSKPKATEG